MMFKFVLKVRHFSFAVLAMALTIPAVYADVSGDLGHFFDKVGYATDVTNPHAYHGQSAGLYSGGSLFLRSTSRALSMAHVDTPSWKAGCAGVDIFTGGASFVSTDQLVSFGKNIMADAAPYTFQLAMETYLPQPTAVMTKLMDWSQQMNQNNLTSCNAAQDLVGGLWPKNTQAQRQICQDVGVQGNQFSDWAAARQGCGSGGQGSSVLDKYRNSPQGKNKITRSVNIVWQAINKNGFLQNDTQLSEFFMSLSGTIVFDKKGKPSIYPSLIHNSDLMNALMNGGHTTIYQCRDTEKKRCLDVDTGEVTISPSSALVYRVNHLLLNIESRYQADLPLTKEEQGFLAKTSLPVLKFIQVSLESGNSFNTQNYAQLIAQELLNNYLEGIIQLVQQSLSSAQYGDVLKRIENNLAKAMQVISQRKTNAFKKIQAETALIKESLAFQKEVAGQLSSKLQMSLRSGG
jgi:conjugative transfer pilus assembly protein TraH